MGGERTSYNEMKHEKIVCNETPSLVLSVQVFLRNLQREQRQIMIISRSAVVFLRNPSAT